MLPVLDHAVDDYGDAVGHGHRRPLYVGEETEMRGYEDQVARLKQLRLASKRSWVNIHAAARDLQGLSHVPFGTPDVASSSLSLVRRIVRETGLSLSQIEIIADRKRKV
jgi:hypothetical protein